MNRLAGSIPKLNVQLEIRALQQDALRALQVAAPIGAWLWLYDRVSQGYDPFTNLAPILVVGASCWASYRTMIRRHQLAAWFLLIGMTLGGAWMLFLDPSLVTILFGFTATMAAHAILEGTSPLGVAILVGLSHAYAWMLAHHITWTDRSTIELLLFVGAATIVGRWSAGALRSTLEMALEGWNRAHEALGEARQRQGELYRVVRALEEALLRVERTNNELVAAQHEASQARAFKSRFVAMVSHELRAPLNLILGFARLMALSPEAYGEPLPQAYRADVYTIYRNCQHILSLIDDILDLSQIEADRIPLVKKRTDLQKDVIEPVVRMLEPLAKRKGLGLVVDVEDLPTVLVDPVRLRQVLLNLAVNAVRLTEQGEISIRAQTQGPEVLVQVRDTGPGIAQEDLPKLFREFSQVIPKQAKDMGSTGLGLAISKHLVTLHGGQIWAESQKGIGSTFSFTIPFAKELTPPRATVRTERRALERELPICIVVHEDTDIAHIMARYIEGYRMIGVANPAALCALLPNMEPDAIIAPIALSPEMSKVLTEIGDEIPLILCDLPKRTGRDSGAVAFLPKPISTDAVSAVIRRLRRQDLTRILIVDDEPDAVRLLERLLLTLPQPYDILRAYGGEEAIQLLRRERVDLIFLDLVMPGIDGWQVLKHLQTNATLRDIPVIIVSGKDRFDENMTIGSTFELRLGRAVPLDLGIRSIEALLGAARRAHLTRKDTHQRLPGASEERSVFGGPAQRPKLMPSAAD